jgi:hypothetical protein
VNETLWQAGNDPLTMLSHVEAGASERKLRLFACACVRHRWALIPHRRQRGAVELAERLAEGQAKDAELEDARQRAEVWPYDAPEFERLIYQAAAYTLAESALEAARGACSSILDYAAIEGAWEAIPGEDQSRLIAEAAGAEGRALGRLAVEVFGNPFRPVTVERAWLAAFDGAALAMARWIDEEWRIDEMPYLADALTDAGCTADALIRHLRGEGPHVRGCWALDLVLGRS